MSRKLSVLLCMFLIGIANTIASKDFCLLIIKNGIFYGLDLEKYLVKRNISYFVADKDSSFKEVMKHTFKGIILTGGPLLYSAQNVNIIEKVNINFAAVLNLNVPVLGICFGHQTIIELFGGKMGHMKALSKGLQHVSLIKNSLLFEGLPKELEVAQYHYDCGTEIPYGFELIATSTVCSVEGIQHVKRPIFGLQFHPESSGEHGYRLLDNFLELCGCNKH